jgi:hypothetical protein
LGLSQPPSTRERSAAPPSTETESGYTDLEAEARRRILEAEKRSYWHQFEEGSDSGHTVSRLSEAANVALDAGGSLSNCPELLRIFRVSPILQFLQRIPGLGVISRYLYFDNLAMSYDAARAVVIAQEQAMGRRCLATMALERTRRACRGRLQYRDHKRQHLAEGNDTGRKRATFLAWFNSF